MTKLYFFDTNIISHMMRETTGMAAQRYIAAAKANTSTKMATSVIVQCELEFGLARRPNQRLRAAYENIVPLLEVMPLTELVTAHYAQLRTQLETAGTPIGANDMLIAAHALALDATLVSADAEFLRVPGLRVENWLADQKEDQN
jgi:tRNA(fMet)-specific endonuclease VapC